MTRLLLAASTIAAIAVAAPAAAQYGTQTGAYNNGYNQNNYAAANANMSNRIVQLQTRLDAGIRAGTISRSEANSLRMEMRNLTRLDRQYSRNGYTQAERQDLQSRMRSLRQNLRLADGGNAQYDRYGDNDAYGNGYDNGYYGQGGPYEDASDCTRATGLGGVINGILGTGNDCGLRVGQRATSNLYSLPYQYQSQYREGNGIYYRTDGRMIYQIDARNNTVVRVYSMNR
ncbi:MAG: hypothetical protein E6G94_12550 [Alphaproteobacteria bacterium]|nr:MAG: hypothetical protein E6G94_12550 [Alphaproteobacteria bacterium]